MTKQILLPTEVQRELRATFKVHPVILNRALKYERNSKRDKMLRAAALQRGGLIFTGMCAPHNFCSSCDTVFDTDKGIIHQTFGDRIKIQISQQNNVVKVMIDSRMVATFNDMTLTTWGNALYSLQQIYNRLNV